jgi:uncharacterized protein
MPADVKLKLFLRGLANISVVFGISGAVEAIRGFLFPAASSEHVLAPTVLILYWAGSRWIERRDPADVQFASLQRFLAAGLAIGVALFSTLIAILWLSGMYHPRNVASPYPLLAAFYSALAGAALEELIFRGFFFRLTAGLAGPWTALVLTSAFFGFAHFHKPGATVWTSTDIAIEAGILLGAAYAASNSLWLPIGIHAGWNLAEGAIFGTAVSGDQHSYSWIASTIQGPEIWTGGAFGPEASLIALPICLAAAAFYIRRMYARPEMASATAA